MTSSVAGKVAFVTGGASGIGAALATKLADGGAAVYPVMIGQRSGHIVNTASMAGLVTSPGQASCGGSRPSGTAYKSRCCVRA